jgi:peptidoglycan hydrolase-like protein with peptidoglycan-binding domain
MPRSVYQHSQFTLWRERHRVLLRVAGVLVLALCVVVGVLVGLSGGTTRPHRTETESQRTTITTVTSKNAAALFSVVSTDPVLASATVNSDTPLTVRFTEPLDTNGPMPSLAPSVAGSWQTSNPYTLTFDASAPMIPGSTETLVVPGGPSGMRDKAGRRLAASQAFHFTVASSSLRLQQILAELGYLPVAFTPTGPPPPAKEMAEPQPGNFSWRWANSLSGLEANWAPGDLGPITTGAVMTFENQHGISVDGLAGPQVWAALLQASSTGKANPATYDYVYVSKVQPENLTLYVNGAAQYTGILVNTGVPGDDTPDGTYQVFEHLTASDMSGTNLDGTTYNDPNVPWASYFHGGDALHGFVRASYGYPQSNGCVEMPIAQAGEIWPYTPIGTLVTVTGPAS